MPLTEKQKESVKKYAKSPKGIKANRIKHWKAQGIIVEDWHKFYDYYLSITNCEKCDKLLTSGREKFQNTTKCADHDHTINDRPNFRQILCNSCNSEDKSNNTSGTPNIIRDNRNGKWYFQKMFNKVRITSPRFKTIDEAIKFKLNYLSSKQYTNL